MGRIPLSPSPDAAGGKGRVPEPVRQVVPGGEDDPEGPFALALEARRVTTEGYVSRAFIIGCAAAIADRQLFAMTDSRQVVIRVMEFLLKLDASDLSIMPRQAVRPALGTGSTALGSLLLTALPLAVLMAALLVLGPRRSR